MNLKIDFLDVNCLQWSDHPYDPFDSHSEICWILGIVNESTNEFKVAYSKEYELNNSSDNFVKFFNESHYFEFNKKPEVENRIKVAIYSVEVDNDVVRTLLKSNIITSEKEFSDVFNKALDNKNDNDLNKIIKKVQTTFSGNDELVIWCTKIIKFILQEVEKDQDEVLSLNKAEFYINTDANIKCIFDDKSQSITTLGQSIQKEFDCKSNDGSNHYKTRIEFKISE